MPYTKDQVLPPAVERAIRDSFARQGLMSTMQAQILHVGFGQTVLRMPITDAVGQQHGFAHAGASFALGDSAAGYAALSTMPEGSEVLTIEMKINLIAPASGRFLVARGEVLKAGRRLSVVRATVEAEAADGSRKPVALLQGTMIPS
ncbi:thioesterase [Roseicyclus marinus]|uniref:Medium/long-chain acyl-CoA thioesterase YigI n=2 Tax=Roseicyclus marinus TaxID=2161673 RepID=A0AA48H638_9RHOB|nr:thioesterase [Roseicyclus marinus]